MEIINLEDQEDEIFFGKLTLQEIKKHIFKLRQEPCPIRVEMENSTNADNPNTSLKLIRTQSEPNLISGQEYVIESPVSKSPNWLNNDDSFIRMERFVDDICRSPRNHVNNTELNNTLEVIEYILNNPPDVSVQIDKNKIEKKTVASPKITGSKSINDDLSTGNMKDEPENPEMNINKQKVDKSFQKINNVGNEQIPKVGHVNNIHEKSSNSAIKQTPQKHEYLTPIHTKINLFKTPAHPSSHRITSTTSVKRTPLKTNIFQHISSPVASYIKNGSTVPSMKNIPSQKNLHVPSFIPKYVKNATKKESEKENHILSPQAYKSAKKITTVDVTDENKLSKSSNSQISSALPTTRKLKHICRENAVSKQPNSSIDDLSYRQSELSICKQQSVTKL